MRADLIIASTLIAVGGFVAMQLGIATSIAELVAGMIAGRLAGEADFGIVELLADIGILVLMYVAGLEIDLDQLHKRFQPSLIMGFSAFILPFTYLFIVSFYVLHLSFQACVLVGIALSSTSIAIIYPALRQQGVLCENLMLILSAGMITELLSISLLGLFTPNPWLTGFLVLGLLVFARVFPFLGDRIFKHYKGNAEEFEFKLILLLLLGVALVSESAGFESAILAFFMGMLTSEVVIQHEELMVKLQGIVFGFFAPIFFFSVGLRIDPMTLLGETPYVLLFFLVSFTATYAGSYLSARIILPSYKNYIAALYNSNLTIGVIIALFGYDSGILDFSTYYGLIGAVVLSTTASLILCRTKKPIC